MTDDEYDRETRKRILMELWGPLGFQMPPGWDDPEKRTRQRAEREEQHAEKVRRKVAEKIGEQEERCNELLNMDAQAVEIQFGSVEAWERFTTDEIYRLDYAKRQFSKLSDPSSLLGFLGFSRPRSDRALVEQIREMADRILSGEIQEDGKE
jgi:hypothetical protein